MQLFPQKSKTRQVHTLTPPQGLYTYTLTFAPELEVT